MIKDDGELFFAVSKWDANHAYFQTLKRNFSNVEKIDLDGQVVFRCKGKIKTPNIFEEFSDEDQKFITDNLPSTKSKLVDTDQRLLDDIEISKKRDLEKWQTIVKEEFHNMDRAEEMANIVRAVALQQETGNEIFDSCSSEMQCKLLELCSNSPESPLAIAILSQEHSR